MEKEKQADLNRQIRRFLARAYSRSSIPYLIVGMLLIVAIVIGGHEIKLHIIAIEDWITTLGPWGVLVFIGLFALTSSFFMPDTVLCIIAGALFGLGWGAIVAVVGSLLASMAQFTLAHHLLRSRIQRVLDLKPSLKAIQRAVSYDEFRLQLLLRLMPLNPATINYLLGAAGVRFTGFLLASLAHTPNLLIEIYFGYVGKHAVRLAGSDTNTTYLHDAVIFGVLVVCIAVMVLIAKIARKALMRAVTETSKLTALK